jgi:hypothetical protein
VEDAEQQDESRPKPLTPACAFRVEERGLADTARSADEEDASVVAAQ